MKQCFKCGLAKDVEEFYRHPQMADGRLGKCKACTKADVTARRNANLEAVRAYDSARAKLPHRRAKAVELTKAARARNPLYGAAHNAVARALRAGKLFWESCQVCGSWETHAHHDDYAKPLVVRWLCAEHHKLWHQTEAA